MSETTFDNRIIDKSHKDHICEHCRLKIPKGSSYVISCGVFDSEFYAVKQHHECKDAYLEFNDGAYDCFPLDGWEGFGEHRDDIRGIYNSKALK